MVARTRLNITFYVHCLSCLMLNLVVHKVTTGPYRVNQRHIKNFTALEIVPGGLGLFTSNSYTNIQFRHFGQ